MACGANQTLESRFNSMKQYIELFSGDPNRLIQMLPNTGSAATLQNNMQTIQKLKEMHAKINQRQSQIDGILKEFTTMTVDNNVLGGARNEISEIVTKKKDKSSVFSKVFQPYDQRLQAAQKLIEENKMDITNLCGIAKGLSGAIQGASTGNDAKAIEDMATQVNNVNRMFVDMSEGVAFFQELSNRLTTLSNQVNDFVMARDIEKNNLIAQIQGGGGGAGGGARNINVNNPFFNEQSMNFPIGTSVFIPAGQFPGQQGNFQGANLGGQYVQSQYMNQQQGAPFQQPGYPYHR
jgi:DNA repair exonuclease SbcCD ATPase subunit